MPWASSFARLSILAVLFTLPVHAQAKHKVIIDQDCAGPGGTDMQAILTLINSPETDVLGISVLTGGNAGNAAVQQVLGQLNFSNI